MFNNNRFMILTQYTLWKDRDHVYFWVTIVPDMRDARGMKYDASHEGAFPIRVCKRVSSSLNSMLNPKQTDSTNHVFNWEKFGASRRRGSEIICWTRWFCARLKLEPWVTIGLLESCPGCLKWAMAMCVYERKITARTAAAWIKSFLHHKRWNWCQWRRLDNHRCSHCFALHYFLNIYSLFHL